MSTRALDADGLLAAGDPDWSGAPDGTIVGHIHLRVGDLGQARGFYAGVLGLDVVNDEYPGGLFLSREGYHHHVGANMWRSRGAGRMDPSRAGLRWFEMALDEAGYDKAAAALGLPERGDGAIEAEDPWGIKVRLVRA